MLNYMVEFRLPLIQLVTTQNALTPSEKVVQTLNRSLVLR